MTRFLAPLLVLLALAAPALAQTRALPPGEIRANGDITFGNALKLGKREGNKTVITPDTLRILGPGSTGPVDGMDVTPPGETTRTLDAAVGLRAPRVANNAALSALVGVSTVLREGFATPGDGGRAAYTRSDAPCAVPGGDGGSMVPGAGNGCWNIDAPFLTPEMFGAKGNSGLDDKEALARWAAAGARLRVPLRMPGRTYVSSGTLTITNAMSLEADLNAVLNRAGSGTVGIQFQAGNYPSGYRLPALGNWPTALKLSGSALVTADVPFIGGGNTAIVIDSGAGAALDNVIRVGSIFEATYGAKVECNGPAHVMQGNRVEVNFITTTQKPYAYTGTICSSDGNTLLANAIDITPEKGGGAAIINEATPDPVAPHPNGANIPRASLIVRDWFGGAGFYPSATGGASQLVKGAFSELLFDVRSAQTWTDANRTDPWFNVVFSDIKLRTFGSGANTPIAADTTGALSGFNGGKRIFADFFHARLTTTTELAPGQVQDFFVYVAFPDQFSLPWQVTQNGSLSLSIVGVLDESQAVEGRLRIRVINPTNGNLPAGTVMNVRVERRM
jgi:hypothetical protein